MTEAGEKPRGNAVKRFLATCTGMTQRDIRNARTTNVWVLVWAVCFVGLSFAVRGGQLAPGLLAWAAVAACTLLGLVVVWYYMRFLREADELLRKIQLEALAIGFGAGFIGTFSLSLLEHLHGWVFDIGDILLLMVAFYVLGIISGMRRYT